MSEMTDAIRQEIAQLDAKIAAVNQQLQAGPSPEDADALTAQLAGLQAERARLQAQLSDLESAETGIAPLGG